MTIHAAPRPPAALAPLLVFILFATDGAHAAVGTFSGHGCCQGSYEEPGLGFVDDCFMVASSSECTGEGQRFFAGGTCVQTGGNSTNCSFPNEDPAPAWGSASTAYVDTPLQLSTPRSIVEGEDVPVLALVPDGPTSGSLRSLEMSLGTPSGWTDLGPVTTTGPVAVISHRIERPALSLSSFAAYTEANVFEAHVLRRDGTGTWQDEAHPELGMVGETEVHRRSDEICLSYYAFDDFSQKLACADPLAVPLVFTPLASVGTGSATGVANAGIRNASEINPRGDWCIVTAFRPDTVNLDLYYECSTNPGQPVVFDRIPFSPGAARESEMIWGGGFFFFVYDDGQDIQVLWTDGTSSFDSETLGTRPAGAFLIAATADLAGRANFALPGLHARLDPVSCELDTVASFPGQSSDGAFAFFQVYGGKEAFAFPLRTIGLFPGESLDSATFLPEPALGAGIFAGTALLVLAGRENGHLVRRRTARGRR